MAKWIKTTPYGDYKDPIQNHRFDNELILNPNTGKKEVYNRIGNILHEAKWHFGKHIGSKKLTNILILNKRANESRHLIKDYIDKTSSTNAGKQ